MTKLENWGHTIEWLRGKNVKSVTNKEKIMKSYEKVKLSQLKIK